MKKLWKILQWIISIFIVILAITGFSVGDYIMAIVFLVIGIFLSPPIIKILFGHKKKTNTTEKADRQQSLEKIDNPKGGYVNGYHYTEYVDTVKELKRNKKYTEAIDLLLKLVDATEKESKAEGTGVAPYYYEELAVIYRKLARYDDEVKILERYNNQRKAPGKSPSKLAERLKKAKEIASSKRTSIDINYEPQIIQRQGVQILESLHILSNTKNIDTLKGRFEFIEKIYDNFIDASNNKRFVSDIQHSIDEYKTTYYERIPTESEISLLIKPDKEKLRKFYIESIFNCFKRYQEEQENQIESLKRQDAKNRRIKKILSIAKEAKEEMIDKSTDKENIDDFLNEIEEIIQAYNEYLESEN